MVHELTDLPVASGALVALFWGRVVLKMRRKRGALFSHGGWRSGSLPKPAVMIQDR